MPCALTLAIAVQAPTTKSAAAGAMLMMAFGAGTLPSMVSVGLLFARLSETSRAALLRAAAVLIVLMGVLQIWQGLASSWLAADAVLQTASRADVVAYGVSVGTLTTEPFLKDLVDATGGTLYQMESTANLSGVFLRVLNEFRQRYLLSYTPQGVSKDGWHRLDVRVKGRRVAIKARPGYLAGS